MISFSPDFSNLTRFSNVFSRAGGQSTQSLSKVDVQSATQTGLSIVTAEGDKVTLSTQASFQGTGVKYNARGVVEGQALSLRSNALEGTFSSQKHITIEGDLNEQEIRDIQRVVSQMNGLRQNVVSGNLSAAFNNGQEIVASGSIARVDLNIQHSESVSTQKTSLQQGSNQQPGPSGSQISDVPKPKDFSSSLLNVLKSLFDSSENNNLDVEKDVPAKISFTPPIENEKTIQTNQHAVASKPIQDNDDTSVKGLYKFLERVSDKIFKKANRLAELSNKLKERVERQAEKQAEKITQAFERLENAKSEGDVRRAGNLQKQVDRRLNKLENTTERIGSRIDRVTNKLNNLIGSLTDRLSQLEAPPQNSASKPVTTSGAPTQVEQPPDDDRVGVEA